MNFHKFVIGIKRYIEMGLEELLEGSGEFCEGQRYAYVDLLEMMQNEVGEGERANLGLDYAIEERYPLK